MNESNANTPEVDNPVVDPFLDDDFTFFELNEAVSKLAMKKAPGPDAIINEIWRSLSNSNRLCLLDSIDELWRNTRIPHSLTEIVITPIFKKGDKASPGNYRPISLVNTSLKLITMLMTNRLNEWCETNAKISKYQAAYRKGMGCENQVFVLNSILQCKLNTKKGRVYALFVDLSKHFDSICHSKLWSRLEAIGLSTKFISFIKVMYKNVTAKVRTPHGESCPFPMEKGVLQGESLSPKLFTLFIDEIVEIMHKTDIPTLKIAANEIHLLLYADDIVLLASNALELQLKINVLKNYFDCSNLLVNLEKTKCVVFRLKRNRKSSVPVLFWGEEQIEVVDKYTYLGVKFYYNLNYKETYNDILKKSRVAEKNVFDIYRKAKLKTFTSRYRLFESLVRSVLFYCSSIWGLKQIDCFIIFQNKFLRRLFSLPNKTPSWFLRLETNATCIEVTYIRILLRFWSRIICSHQDSLVKDCYIALKRCAGRQTIKHNWYRN
jgi:hypothetical protein